MNLYELVDFLVGDTQRSVRLFLPELVLCATIFVMLIVRVFRWGQRVNVFYLALIGSAVALGFAMPRAGLQITSEIAPQGIFTDLLVYDSFTVFFRCLLLLFVVLFCLLTRITGIADEQTAPDFYSLVLGATLGMCLMVSANHLLMVFLAVEMASVPSYVLAGMLKGNRKSSEAALKYSVYGAGAAGVMLYGISLLCGVLGTAHLPTAAAQLVAMDLPQIAQQPEGAATIRVLALGALMLMVGLAFKLSAVPFHFWCPDVFEGAAAEVGAFLSVASKAAALALLVRIALAFGAPPAALPVAAADAGVAQASPAQAGIFNVADSDPAADPAGAAGDAADRGAESAAGSGSAFAALAPSRNFLMMLVAVMAAVTCTFGNLAAYGQTNVKRLLAYSTIAHAGYMMMPVAAALALADRPLLARQAIGSLTLYITIYLFMNLGAFAIVAFLRNETRSEEIADWAGIVRRCPLTVVCFALLMFSLIGLPPLAGFIGKFFIFATLVEAGGPLMMTLLVIAGLNTAISLVYYLRVVKVMTIDEEPDSRGAVSMGFFPAAYALAITLPVLVLGVWFEPARNWALAAATHLF